MSTMSPYTIIEGHVEDSLILQISITQRKPTTVHTLSLSFIDLTLHKIECDEPRTYR